MSNQQQRDLVSRLLKQSILTVCRETINYSQALEVDGILCLTVDRTVQHVVKLHELLRREQKPQQTNGHDGAAGACSASPPPTSPVKSEPNIIHEMLERVNSDKVNGHENAGDINPTARLTPITVKKEPMTPDVLVRVELSNNEESRESRTSSFRDSNHVADMIEAINGRAIKSDVSVKSEASCNPDDTQTKQPVSLIGANISAMESVSKNLEKLTVSKAKNILCKKCSAVLKNVPDFENHNMLAHGHFTCLVCLSTFTSRNNMKRHIRLHTGIKPYSCNKCPESFARNDDFKRHLLRHTFEKPFRCAICKTGYSDRSCVKNHMMKEHNSKVYHICPQCGESFIEAQQFQQHKKSHPEFQDYRCSLCSFTGSNSLMFHKHMLTHGPPKKYFCSHCQLTFSDPFVYTTHLKKHKGDDIVQSFGCCFCEVKLSSYDQFQRHEHSHIQAKQHTCGICQKHFRYPSNLREHMLTHMPKALYAEIANITDSSLGAASNEGDSSSVGEDVAVEENNNDLESFEKSYGDEKSYVDSQIEANGSSEYWCTECNHGFSSEDMLQDHISATHEGGDSVEVFDDDIHNEIAERHAPVYSDRTNEDGTNRSKQGLFAVDLDGELKRSSYDEDTLISRLPTVKRLRAYDEETVIDGQTHNREEIGDSAILNLSKKVIPDVNTADFAFVKNAMKTMQEIQTTFAKMNNTLDKKVGGLDDNVVTAASFDTAFKSKSGTRKRKNASPSFMNYSSEIDTLRSHTQSNVKVAMEGIKLKFKRETMSDSQSVLDRESPSDRHSTSSNESFIDHHNTNSNLSTVSDEASDFRIPLSQYSKTSVLGMDTEFSSTPTRGSPTTLNLQVRNPGFEKVITPDVLFRTKAPFTCEVCEETFEEFDGLDSHGIAVHKRFICSYCGKAFTSRPNRERHVRYHTGEKPYKCDLCSASFIRGDDLKYHRTTKHADVKPFGCGACNSSFALPKDLEKHLRVYPEHRQGTFGDLESQKLQNKFTVI